MMAGTATDAGKRNTFFNQLQCFYVTSLADQGNVPLRVQPSRACSLAGGNAALLYGVGIGDGLGVEFVGRALDAQPHVEPVRDDNGADARALPTTGALIQINVAGLFAQADGEVAHIPVHADHFGIHQQLNVAVAAGLHQFGAEDAHGTVVGGESFVQLGHVSADGRFCLHQVDLEAGLCQVQGGLDPGDAPADDQSRTDDFVLPRHSTPLKMTND